MSVTAISSFSGCPQVRFQINASLFFIYGYPEFSKEKMRSSRPLRTGAKKDTKSGFAAAPGMPRGTGGSSGENRLKFHHKLLRCPFPVPGPPSAVPMMPSAVPYG
ncbi:MAG: hypothetical protein CSB33_03410 [Desulfobacterales bacterium]|nr:MAG: hypothetical protein CSB33_03410 [Desulfobacterales bacterium]